MSFRISGLSPETFRHLFGASDATLKAHRAVRCIVDVAHGYPERIELRDAAVGESLLLVNYTHLPADTPYHASYAVYIREGAEQAYSSIDEVPDVMHRRIIALRAFDRNHMLISADLATGDDIRDTIERLLADERTGYLHAHYAKPGCYAARIDRA